MGALVARMFKNVNLENRAMREISKEKPRPAPRHEPREASSSDAAPASVHQKNDPLLGLLKSVYVESTDPAGAAAAEPSKEKTLGEESEPRSPIYNLPGESFALMEVRDVPKGKLTITEALKALSSRQRQPQMWTTEKIAQEYFLDLKDTKALVKFFVPFGVKIIPPKTAGAKQIKAS